MLYETEEDSDGVRKCFSHGINFLGFMLDVNVKKPNNLVSMLLLNDSKRSNSYYTVTIFD